MVNFELLICRLKLRDYSYPRFKLRGAQLPSGLKRWLRKRKINKNPGLPEHSLKKGWIPANSVKRILDCIGARIGIRTWADSNRSKLMLSPIWAMTVTHRDHSYRIERECPACPTACMTIQMSADLFPQSCTVLENKNIFDLTTNFLAFTILILGRYITGPAQHSLYVYTKISMDTCCKFKLWYPQRSLDSWQTEKSRPTAILVFPRR